MVQPVSESTDLGTDEIPRDVVSGPGCDPRDPSPLDRDLESAGVGTVEDTRGADGTGGFIHWNSLDRRPSRTS